MKPKRHRDPSLLAAIRQLPCAACGKAGPSEAHHVRTKGSGAGDWDYNLTPLCHEDHRAWHYMGPSRFFHRRPDYLGVLIYMGWSWDGKKLTHPRMQKGEG